LTLAMRGRTPQSFEGETMLSTATRIIRSNPMRVASAVASDPLDALAALYDRYLAEHDRPIPSPGDVYRAQDDWEERLHDGLGRPWPCPEAEEFWSTSSQVIKELEAHGIRVGPESLKAWNDGDQAFVRALWCFVRHLRPCTVVETGVGHGMTSRLILEALERNGNGRLWSIDRPEKEPELQRELGIAVGDRFRERWTLLEGTSRRRLPALLSRLGHVDLFVHDSLHSEPNVRFELDHVWPAVSPHGVVVVDDIDANWGFHSFTRAFPDEMSLVCEAEPLRPDTRRFNQKGLFGIILKGAHPSKRADRPPRARVAASGSR
jgi:hypothetical protein